MALLRGRASRSFVIAVPARSSGLLCAFKNNHSEYRFCEREACPENCAGTWGDWSQCDSGCGAGKQQRRYSRAGEGEVRRCRMTPVANRVLRAWFGLLEHNMIATFNYFLKISTCADLPIHRGCGSGRRHAQHAGGIPAGVPAPARRQTDSALRRRHRGMPMYGGVGGVVRP
jgi:hypothetical protein